MQQLRGSRLWCQSHAVGFFDVWVRMDRSHWLREKAGMWRLYESPFCPHNGNTLESLFTVLNTSIISEWWNERSDQICVWTEREAGLVLPLSVAIMQSVDHPVSPAGALAMMCAFLLILFSHLPSNQHFIFFSKFPHSQLIVGGGSAIQPRSHFPPDSCFNTSISNKKKRWNSFSRWCWERSIQVNYEELQSENRAAVVSNTNVSKVGGILWELFGSSHLRVFFFFTHVLLTLWNWKTSRC